MDTDALILWVWEHDADWAARLRHSFDRHGVSCLALHHAEWGDLSARLQSGDLRAQLAIDRVWDWGGEYATHVEAVRRHIPAVLNGYDLVRKAWSRPAMHYLCLQHGLRAPHMLILPSYVAVPEVLCPDLAPLGPRFAVKGAYSGGSGVLSPATTWDEVVELRKGWPEDETTLQTWVEPKQLGGRRAWFRVFYACGASFLCWSDDLTHDQVQVTPAEEMRWGLGLLRGMAQHMAGLCGLNLFSTEIALDNRNLWHVVDYVNEPCDYRVKSGVPNGVPDEVVLAIAERIAGWAERIVKCAARSAPLSPEARSDDRPVQS